MIGKSSKSSNNLPSKTIKDWMSLVFIHQCSGICFKPFAHLSIVDGIPFVANAACSVVCVPLLELIICMTV